MRCSLPILAGSLVLAAFTPLAAGQTFDLVGLPTGTSSAPARGISDDGRVVVGDSGLASSGAYHFGWHWTRSGGRIDLSGSGLPSNTGAYGISGDGRYVVGTYAAAQSYRYDRTTGVFDLLPTPAPYIASDAEDASGDGSVVVGNVRFGTSTSAVHQAYRWTPQGGTQLLGYADAGHYRSFATAVSRDGAAVVGYSFGFQSAMPFIWRENTGMVVLPSLTSVQNSAVYDVNFDGTVAVGLSMIGNDNIACIWRNNIVQSLGLAPGFIRSSARATNDDGSTIVGVLDNGSANSFQAGIWRQGIGWQRLDMYLASIGITLPAGVSLYEATSISADGSTIAGWATVRNGTSLTSQGFVFSIPSPSSLLAIVPMTALMAARRKR